MADTEVLRLLEFIGDAIDGAIIENKHFVQEQWTYRVRLSHSDVVDFQNVMAELRRRNNGT